LATNIDVLFSDELIRFMAQRRLASDGIYRIDRWDVRSNVPTQATVAEQLEFCRNNLLRVYTRIGVLIDPREMQVAWEAAGSWFTLRRRISYLTTPAGRQKILNRAKMFFKPVASAQSDANRLQTLHHRFAFLHVHACGDFTLLARDRWFRIGGYPEWPIFPMHIHAIGVYAAYFDGAREIVLPPPMHLFHIDHTAGWTPEQDEELNSRMARLGVPMLKYSEYLEHLEEMRVKGVHFSTPDWGLANVDLPETRLGRGQ
jgi:hypothetical protein